MDKEKIKYTLFMSVLVISIVMSTIVFIMLLPYMWHDCCLRFKELNGTISASEKNELENQRKAAAEVWW